MLVELCRGAEVPGGARGDPRWCSDRSGRPALRRVAPLVRRPGPIAPTAHPRARTRYTPPSRC